MGFVDLTLLRNSFYNVFLTYVPLPMALSLEGYSIERTEGFIIYWQRKRISGKKNRLYVNHIWQCAFPVTGDICGKLFPNDQAITKHMHVHLKGKPPLIFHTGMQISMQLSVH